MDLEAEHDNVNHTIVAVQNIGSLASATVVWTEMTAEVPDIDTTDRYQKMRDTTMQHPRMAAPIHEAIGKRDCDSDRMPEWKWSASKGVASSVSFPIHLNN